MFYTYDLSFDRTNALSYGVVLTATNGGTPGATSRKNGAPLVLNAIDPQFICGTPGGNPFSSDFSDAFGGPAALPGYPIVTVNKFLKALATQVGFLLEPPTRFHLNSRTAPTSSSQTAHISRLHIGAEFLTVASVGAISLVLARPWHIIQASKNPAAILVRRLISKRLAVQYGSFDSEFSGEFGGGFGSPQSVGFMAGHGLSLHAVSVESLLNLFKVVTLLHAVSSGRSQAIIRVAGRVLAVSSGSSASLFRSFGRLLARTLAEATAITRGLPQRIGSTSGEAPRLSFGGGNLFARAFGALSGEGVGLRRGQAVLRGMLGANVAQIGRAPGKVTAGISAEVAGLTKQPGSLRSATDGQAMASRRQPSLVRAVVGASAPALLAAAAHTGALYATITAQVAAVFTQRTFGRSLSLQRAQASFVSLSSVRSLLRAVGVGSPQAIRVARGMAKSVSVLTATAQSIARSAGKIIGAGSINVASLVLLGAHFFIAGIASPETVAQRASHSAVKSATSPETASIARRRGAFLSAASANAASINQRLVKLLPYAAAQVISVTNAISKALALATAEIAAAIKGGSQRPAVASQESSSVITRHGSSLGTLSSGQVSALRRLTSKFLPGLLQQVLGSGRGDTKKLSVVSPNSAIALRPRGLAIRARQGQAPANVVYYHFFVAPWAYQQTSLLPPFGGPAEPPSFGPIDPADQTIFGFDWTSRAYPNDTILSAVVTCVPPYLPFLAGSLFINGTLVEVTVPPFPEPSLPIVYSLRCTATFASGRISSFSIPVPVRTL